MRPHIFLPVSLACLFWFIGSAVGARADDADLAGDKQTLQKAGVKVEGPALLEVFRRRTLTPQQQEAQEALVRQLGDPSFRVRQKAFHALLAARSLAVPFLIKAMKDPDAEVASRAERCLRRIDREDDQALVAAAARFLAQVKPPGTAKVLLAYLPSASSELVSQEVQAALNAVAFHQGKPDGALVKALQSPLPVLRAAAGEALIRCSSPEARAKLRRLLRDADAGVRLRAALAFLEARDKEAVPVLIALLAELPAEQAWPVEDALYRLAGEDAPALPEGQKSPRALSTAWAGWWDHHKDRIDLAKIDLPRRQLGYKLLVLSGTPRGDEVVELDREGKVRWRISRLGTVRDAQVLPGNRVLIVEESAGRVTERDFQGKVLWEKKVSNPFACERLPGGRTFIATRNQLLIVSRSGAEQKISHPSYNNQTFCTACRFPDGQCGVILNYVTFKRINAQGKEAASFATDFFSVIGHVEILPRRRLLVPEYRKNRLAEYDYDGKFLTAVPVQQPTDVVVLPNGHFLVSSWTRRWMGEIDRNGKAVWEKPLDGMPCRVRVR